MRALPLARRRVDVAGHEARRESEAAAGLDHQDREIPAGAGVQRQGLGGSLDAGFQATRIAEVGVHRPRHIGQQGEQRGAPVPAQETPGPELDRPGGIRMRTLDQPGQVRGFLRVVAERKGGAGGEAGLVSVVEKTGSMLDQ